MKGQKKKGNNLVRILIVVLAIGFVFFGVKLATGLSEQNEERTASHQAGPPAASTWGNRVDYEGAKYRTNNSISTFLFLGIDYGAKEETGNMIGTGGRSDTIILFVMDDDTKTIRTLLIPRDTMVSVDLYDQKGEYSFSGTMQINMQYTFGDSRKRSCFLTKKKVSDLLLGVRIDDHLSLDAEGIAPIVDQMGGIPVTFHEDYTDIDPAYEKRKTMTLTGADMEKFVRERDIETSGSAITRSYRHFDLLQNAFESLQKNKTGKSLEDVLSLASEYIESDLDTKILEKLRTYKFEEEAIMLPGELKKGELHDEYYADEKAVAELVLKLFYTEQ
ncbi:MAG: LCP family protein [Lachnospiraceae bacterium]|nr:LCP family protein [Lachnospiraceae bacterium]